MLCNFVLRRAVSYFGKRQAIEQKAQTTEIDIKATKRRHTQKRGRRGDGECVSGGRRGGGGGQKDKVTAERNHTTVHMVYVHIYLRCLINTRNKIAVECIDAS